MIAPCPGWADQRLAQAYALITAVRDEWEQCEAVRDRLGLAGAEVEAADATIEGASK